MIEKLKSALLALLVFSSLLQSYFLVYSTPNFDPLNQTEYVKTELIGSQEEVENLVFPGRIVLHFGDESHTVLYPNTTFYEMIYQGLQKRTFDGLRAISNYNRDWDLYRKERLGVEILFDEGIPINVLQRTMQIQQSELFPSDTINRIWIYANDNEEGVRSFFFSDEYNRVYEALKADLDFKDVERFVGLGELQTKYRIHEGNYYVPEKPLKIAKLSVPFQEFSPDQLHKSLFVDPEITRRIEEWDGTIIYTDGKRGLQINNDSQWFVYSDPVAPTESYSDIRDDLLSAVQFVNQQGGWNGTFHLVDISRNRPEEGQKFLFRQYIQSYPILPTTNVNFGFIQVVLQKGVVSNYERSLFRLQDSIDIIGESRLSGGSELLAQIERFPLDYLIDSVIPAYRPYVMYDRLELIPEWAVRLRDGSYRFLDP